ncbi:MAG: biopolymer transporter ExbD [Phycisphaerae bacterium]|jgi:biopolymer transport protein ExbD|nr:biopolymer transporter ExbD [Phycisphaerae bacterium]
MRFRREEGAGEGIINLESLLDVMFILLIFFMATTTFKEEEFDIKVNLPDASKKRTALSSATKLIVVNVRGEDRNEGDALYVVSGSKVDLLQLRKMIADGVKANKNQKVLIRGDKLALHGNVANAVAACRDGGVVEANIGYDYVPTQ